MFGKRTGNTPPPKPKEKPPAQAAPPPPASPPPAPSPQATSPTPPQPQASPPAQAEPVSPPPPSEPARSPESPAPVQQAAPSPSASETSPASPPAATPSPSVQPEPVPAPPPAASAPEQASIPEPAPPPAPQPTIAPEQPPVAAPPPAATPKLPPKKKDEQPKQEQEDAEVERPQANPRLERARKRIWSDLRDGIDLKSLARMDAEAARAEILSAVQEIGQFRGLDVTAAELAQVAKEAADDMLGFGPLEELLEMDGIADIMINGPKTIYMELNGKIQRATIEFRDNQHLLTICQRIVGVIGRRVDESSPICDARLPDGSRVNVIIPPLAVDGCAMTIRKFTKEKLTLDKLMEFGSMTPACAEMIKIVGTCRANVLVSGGTGSGKTTMLNCLTRYMSQGERIITCEDACELQLQQPHVVRLETRPPNLEGVGEVKMRDLIKNCLRMRPDRIIVGEVRGPEAFDLLQAMNTGHDGSMGTVHANNPREALSRMENMIAMGGLNLPIVAVREQIASAVNIIIQVQRLRDGSRKVTHISEITGMEGDVVTMQDLFRFEYEGEDEYGRIVGTQKSSGLRPILYDRARQFGLEDQLLDAMAEAYN